ncbi:hypothetical protein MHBO_000599 [Bonamia ostreae]|uniref:Uncharacterized protein n=1 Tax=Bonamia ostreae TaxID=126728 RepID=A0ABV2AG39_9EUKA
MKKLSETIESTKEEINFQLKQSLNLNEKVLASQNTAKIGMNELNEKQHIVKFVF